MKEFCKQASRNSAKQSLDLQHSQGILEGAEVFDLWSEQQVAELGEGQEDDDEHDKETGQVLGTSPQGGWQLSHGLVEADVLEDLYKTATHCHRNSSTHTHTQKTKKKPTQHCCPH